MRALRGSRVEGMQELGFVESRDATLGQGGQYRGGLNPVTTRCPP